MKADFEASFLAPVLNRPIKQPLEKIARPSFRPPREYALCAKFSRPDGRSVRARATPFMYEVLLAGAFFGRRLRGSSRRTRGLISFRGGVWEDGLGMRAAGEGPCGGQLLGYNGGGEIREKCGEVPGATPSQERRQ